MVETISPVVYGSRARYWVAVMVHTLGAALSAALLGAALGAVGLLLVGTSWTPGTLVFLGALALLYIARDALRLPIPLLERRRQVPQWWREYFSPNVAAGLYGISLGVGFLTFMSFGTFLVVAVGAVASASPLWGAVVSAPFGIARGVTVALSARVSPSEEQLLTRIESWRASKVPRAANVAALVVLLAASASTL